MYHKKVIPAKKESLFVFPVYVSIMVLPYFSF